METERRPCRVSLMSPGREGCLFPRRGESCPHPPQGPLTNVGMLQKATDASLSLQLLVIWGQKGTWCHLVHQQPVTPIPGTPRPLTQCQTEPWPGRAHPPHTRHSVCLGEGSPWARKKSPRESPGGWEGRVLRAARTLLGDSKEKTPT